jgi:hypothetical protein
MPPSPRRRGRRRSCRSAASGRRLPSGCPGSAPGGRLASPACPPRPRRRPHSSSWLLGPAVARRAPIRTALLDLCQ